MIYCYLGISGLKRKFSKNYTDVAKVKLDIISQAVQAQQTYHEDG
jgi:hypothetical protein